MPVRADWRGASALCLGCLLLAASPAPCSSAFGWIIGVDEIAPEDLNRLISSSDPPLLVDVTTREEFIQQGHIRGSISAPLDQLDSLRGALGVNEDRTVVTVCLRGVRSALAASKLKGQGLRRVYSLSGGKVGWSGQGFPLETGDQHSSTPKVQAGPTVQLSQLEQLVSVLSGFVVKPAYMLLSLILVVYLFRGKSREIRLMRAGLAAFFAGELFCAINFLCTGGGSFPLDMLHGLGMVGMGMLVPWGCFVLVDERMVGLTQPNVGCSLRRFCGRCWKQEEAPCVAHRIFMLVAPAMAVVSLMPWTAPLRELSEVGIVFGTPVAYSYSLPLQLADFRAYPMIGAVCFSITTALLLTGRRAMRSAQPFFFAGVGFMTFALFRFLLLSAYRDAPVWCDFWEEITELFFILITTFLIWQYRAALGLTRAVRATSNGPGE